MDIRRNKNATLPFIVLFSLLTQLPAQSNSADEIQVGVILDMGSWLGKTLHSCIAMAISDFYALNNGYKTRIVLHTRDSKGDPLHALSVAIDLLDKNKVQAIIGPQTFLEAKFLAVFSNKFKVPIFSFTASHSSFTQYSYFVQITQDEPTQFKVIASLVESFKWRNVIYVYEDTDSGRDVLPNMFESFIGKNIQIVYRTSISLSASNAQIFEELSKLMTVQTTVFIVHMSPSLASRFFLTARRLGMVSKGYAWILTEKTLNVLYTRDAEVIKSLQGALGLMSYVPQSHKLSKFNLRWRNKQYSRDSIVHMRKFRVLGLLAYDATWALANAVERIRVRGKSGKSLLNEISRIRFKGLSGEYQIVNGKLITNAFEIVNVKKKWDSRVGFWTRSKGNVKEIYPSSSMHISSASDLDKIMWPGMSEKTPKGWLMRTRSKKLRIAVPRKLHFKELVNIDYDNQTNEVTFNGFCIDVFRGAIEALPYEVDYEFISFLGTYDDLVYQLYLEKYDAVVGDVTITANRSQYVDFTLPFTDMGVGTIARVNQKDMWIFLRPLDPALWLTCVAFFILTGFIVWVIEHPSNPEFQGSLAQQIGTVFWFTFSILVFAHREKMTSNLSKFLVVVWLFAVLILTSSYTATLSSMLTVQQIRLTAKGDFIGYSGWTFMQGFIVNNLNFLDYKLQPYDSPEKYADALSRGSKNGGASAIITEIPYVKVFLANYPKGYSMVTSQPTTNGFGFTFRKGSPLVPEMSREIAKLREEGKLMMMEEKWFKSESSLLNQDSATKPETLDLDNFRGLFVIAGLSSTLALLILLINYLLHQNLPLLLNYCVFRLLGGGRLAFMARYLFARNNVHVIQEINAR